MRRFMYGRYGTDHLNQAMVIAALVLVVLGWLGSLLTPWLSILSWIAYIPLVWSLVRMFSRNIDKRRRQNAQYLRFREALRDKEHRYYRCPRCKQAVRVPRGRGRINIRCPKCGGQFMKKT